MSAPKKNQWPAIMAFWHATPQVHGEALAGELVDTKNMGWKKLGEGSNVPSIW